MIANFKPTLWAARLQANLDKTLVFRGLVNTDYEGEVKVGGTVKINRPGRITVSAYEGSVAYQAPTSTQQTLAISKDEYFAFAVDDLDRVQANVNLVDTYTQEAAYSLGQNIDADIAGLYVDAGAGSVIALTLASGDYYDALVEAGMQLDKNSVPRAGRWHVTSPEGYAALLKNDKFIHATAQGDAVVASGFVGQAAGFRIIVSNNLVVATGTKSLFGTNAAISFAQALEGNPEALRLQGQFGDGVRGRVAWGRKVIEPKALGVINLT